MTTYAYEGLDQTGRKQKGMAEAASLKEAREKLLRGGIFAERVAMVGGASALNTDARATIYRELSSLLSAGLPLDQALALLVQSGELSSVHGVLAGLCDAVREGVPFSEALAKASPSVSSFEKAIVQVAERSATMDRMLDHLASYIEDQARIKSRVESALFYPGIVLVAGICVALLMLGLLVPRAAALLQDNGGSLPLLTRFMLVAGRVSLYAALPVFVACMAGAARWRKQWREDHEFACRWNQRLFGLPMVGESYKLLVTVRFTKTMAILIQGGVSLIDSLVLAGRATGSPWLADRCKEESEAVRNGVRLSEAVARIGPLSDSLPGLLRIGEAGGGLRELMEKAGLRYQERWERLIQKRLMLLEPVLILTIGVFVLMVVLSILLPILAMTRSIAP